MAEQPTPGHITAVAPVLYGWMMSGVPEKSARWHSVDLTRGEAMIVGMRRISQ